MQTHRFLVAAGIAAAVLLGSSGVTAQGAPCFETNIGQSLGLTDDSVARGVSLGFAFPMPGGNTTSTVDVSSNGQIYLVPGLITSPRCCNGVVATFLNAACPTIAPLWTDLTPSGTPGNVYVNTFPGRAVFTWSDMREFGQATTALMTVQCQLLADGSFTFYYDRRVRIVTHTTVVGVTQASNAPDPGPVDLSVLPIPSLTNPTIYEYFAANAIDLAGSSHQYLPSGQNGYVVTGRPCASVSSYGAGCPANSTATFYELFPNGSNDLSTRSFDLLPNGQGGFVVTSCATSCWESTQTNALTMTDDSVVSNLALGFTANYGIVRTSSIAVCSNGYVWLRSGSSTVADFTPTVAELLAQPARIAPFWTDLNPGAGGTVYFDTFPNKAVVTWNQVPEFGSAGSISTLQLQLFNDGRALFSYQTVSNATHPAMVGFTEGAGASDPGAIDLTASIPFSSGRGAAPTVLASINQPVLGQTFQVAMTAVPVGSLAAAVNVGASQLAIDLSFLGLTGCSLLAAPDLGITLANPTATASLPLPNIPALIGGTLYLQGLVIAPGANAFGAATSNGLAARLGN